MQLLVIRHARAESVKEFAKTNPNDDLRPLTEEGRERMRLGAAGLHRLIEEIDVLASSPLVRARQTADIVAAEFGGPDVVEIDALRPGTAHEAFAEWIEGAGARETIAIVGHDTHLSELVSWLMTGRAKSVIEIKKGASVLLKLRARARRRPGARSAKLIWALTPRQLRMLGS